MKTKKIIIEKNDDVIVPDVSEQKEQLKNDYNAELEEKIEEPKKKRGRPKKVAEKESIDSESFNLLSKAFLSFVSSRMPNKIEPNEIEINIFSGALQSVLNKYSLVSSEYAPEITLILSIVLFVLPRIKKDETATI